MTSADDLSVPHPSPPIRGAAAHALELGIIVVVYFLLAKFGLALASINPSATPVWPPTGFAFAVVLLRGYRVAPAILAGAFAVNVITAGSIATSLAIGVGNMLEGLIGAALINRWLGGRDAFASPAGVARFAMLCFIPTVVSASIGVGSLAIAGFVDGAMFGSVWLTWWLGDLAGALVITPVFVLWAASSRQSLQRGELAESIAVFAGACAIGAIAFTPLVDHSAQRAPLGFLAAIPLLWSALRRGQRDTATVALILCGFAVVGTIFGAGPFAQQNLNESFLLLLMFMISIAVPSLALSADVAVRKRTEEELRRTRDELNERVERRTTALTAANSALQGEVDRRKYVEAALDQQRRHLLEAQRLANLGSWVRDLETNSVAWSAQLYQIYGIKPDEFAGNYEAVLARVHPEDRERVHAQARRAMESGEGYQIEARIVRPSGEVRHLQNLVEMVKDADGRAVRMIGISQDVTERRAAESELERAREQLAHMQKMEAIAQLTGGIAHDFNNLLMIVSGHAEMLRRRLSEQKQLAGLDAILGAARRGEKLTRQLLTFSRRQPLHAVPTDLRAQIEAVRPMLVGSLHGDISLVVDVPAELWPVEVDVAELELALVNLAVNARDAMPEGGTFTVSARNVAAHAGARVAQPPGDRVEIALTDTGEGIAPDTIKKIFDPFFTTKAVGKGTGLGLSQVYGFAMQSGGAVGVVSQVGHGTTITLRLPRSRGAAPVVEEAARPSLASRAEGTILMVEDNPDVSEVTATLLEQIGYRVLRAENATEALERLEEGGNVDLLFSDIVMPNGMNGIHLAQEVSLRYPNLGVLLTTGYSEVAESAETRFPILRKPFEAAALERAISEAMAANGAPHQLGPRGSAL
jgi:PAS domain S-box-containing protein